MIILNTIYEIFVSAFLFTVIITIIWDLLFNAKSITNSIIKMLPTIMIIAGVIFILYGMYELKKCKFGSKFEIDFICDNTWKFIVTYLWYLIGFIGSISYIVYYSYNIKKK